MLHAVQAKHHLLMIQRAALDHLYNISKGRCWYSGLAIVMPTICEIVENAVVDTLQPLALAYTKLVDDARFDPGRHDV